MALRFRKKVARPGVVLPKNPLTKQRKVEVITKEKLKRACDTGNAMLEAGILIPLPYAHTDENGVYPLTLVKGVNDTLLDAKTGEPPKWDLAVNAGFVTGWEIDEADGGLVAIGEAEGDPENQDTHAGRIGKTFKQTSPLIVEKWQDGSGKVWNDAPLHVALTNRGVQSGQEDFQLLLPDGNPNQELIAKQGLPEAELAIAMALDPESYADAANAIIDADGFIALADNDPINTEVTAVTPEQVTKIKQLLKDKLAITLPDDTDNGNIGDRLVVILTNMEPRKDGDDLLDLPTGGEVLQSPIIMSTPNPASAATPAGAASSVAGANANATGANANPDDLVLVTKKATAMTAKFTQNKQAELKARVKRAMQKGAIGLKRAREYWQPKINAIALSLDDFNDDGSIISSPLELALAELEEANGITEPLTEDQVAALAAEGGFVPEEADDMGASPESKEVTEEMVKQHFAAANR